MKLVFKYTKTEHLGLVELEPATVDFRARKHTTRPLCQGSLWPPQPVHIFGGF